jgi:hypothetical protein
MIKCPYCPIEEENRDEMWSHILTFHQDETKEKLQKKIEQHPIAFLKEAGFEVELNRMAQGLCPLCGGVVMWTTSG